MADLLQRARAVNEQLGVTGILLHAECDGSFFQVLEGEREAIDYVFHRIILDKRHSHLTTIIKEPIAERSFADWTMGFSSVSPESLAEIRGLNDFFQGGSCFTELDAERAKKLLAAFAEGGWRAKRQGASQKAA